MKCTTGCRSCGDLTIVDYFGVGFRTNYSNDADCEWIVAPSTSGLRFLVFQSNFNTQKDKDVVRVVQCTALDCTSPQDLAVLSGTFSTTRIVPLGSGFAKVTFTSDSSEQGTGFKAVLRSVRQLQILFVFCHRGSLVDVNKIMLTV